MMIINRLKSKLHRNTKGFTLAEVLITVAIIIVLMAVAAPNLIQHQKSLKRMELNKTAQEIFLAVQNTMTDYKAAGTLESIMDESVKECASVYPEKSDKVHLYSFGSDSLFYKQYISNPALSVISGGFSVEFYKETCEVYRVIYAEDAETYSGLLDAANAGSSLDDYPAMEKTGSYGENAPTLPSDYYDQDEKIVLDYLSVSNGDELTLSLKVKDALAFAATVQNLTISITYTDAAGNSESPFVYSQGQPNTEYNSATQTFTIILDNINEANRVQFYSDKPNLVKGANVTAAVDIVYKNGNDERHLDTKESNYKVSFNPLFDSATDGEMIYVSCLRHLINLNLDKFETDAFKPVKISQVNPIDVNYSSLFAPIELDIEFDGNNQAIKNLPATMFASRNSNISNVIITDPKINGSGAAGALVQKQTGGTISNCRAYVVTGIPSLDAYKEYGVSGTGSVGGLIASAENAEIINSFAAINVTGNNYVGGFAGRLENCTVKYCYSSGEVINNGNGSAGGFVAEASGSGIFKSCYSTSDVSAYSANNSKAGGFAAEASGTLTDCYSFGRLMDLSLKNNQYAEAEKFAGFSFLSSGMAIDDYASCNFLQRDFFNVDDAKKGTYTSNNGYNEYVDVEAGNGLDYADVRFKFPDGKEARAAVPYDKSLNKEPTGNYQGHQGQFPFYVQGFPESIPHYGNFPHNYVISDNIIGDYSNPRHQYICTICGSTYEYSCHISDQDVGFKYCDVCETTWKVTP